MQRSSNKNVNWIREKNTWTQNLNQELEHIKRKQSELKNILCAQSCPTLCDPMDCSPPGSSVHGIFQARTLQCVVISYSRGSFQPWDQTHISYVSCTGRQILLPLHHVATPRIQYLKWKTLEGINSRLGDTEEGTRNLEDGVIEIIQSEQRKKLMRLV